MKILFTGKPNKGSWQIRAVQMAAGFARCIPYASEQQCREADFIVALKRVPDDTLQAIRASGRPWAWDAIDAYPQPLCASWDQARAVAWLKFEVLRLRPTVVCWANRRMQEDAGGGGVVIHHHHRPGIECNPIRERIKVIGYEGSSKFLGHWRGALTSAAKSIGAEFTDRPESLARCDVVVAMRDGEADCYATRNWKSNVKLANAHGSGTPFIGQPDPGYLAMMAGGEQWVERVGELGIALARIASRIERKRIQETFLRNALSVTACQKEWLKVAECFA